MEKNFKVFPISALFLLAGMPLFADSVSDAVARANASVAKTSQDSFENDSESAKKTDVVIEGVLDVSDKADQLETKKAAEEIPLSRIHEAIENQKRKDFLNSKKASAKKKKAAIAKKI